MSTLTTATASAPGKLFILGEYAVLHGAPATLAAVDARAWIRIHPAEDGEWRINAPDVDVSQLVLNSDGSLPATATADTRRALKVFDAVRMTIAETVNLPPCSIDIDTAGFAGQAGKLGIGGSAAIASALTGAFNAIAAQQPNRETLLNQAITAHRRAQAGEGSGADVATALLGGIVAFARDARPIQTDWPTDLHALAVPTGHGADTPTLVGATRRLADDAPATHKRCLEPLIQLARDGAHAFAEGDVGTILDIANAYFDGLTALSHAANAAIVTSTHHHLRQLVAEAGGVFKPTGAGGGDLGLVLADSQSTINACATVLEAAGHPPVALHLGASGMASTLE